MITVWVLLFTVLKTDGSHEIMPGGMPYSSRSACTDAGVRTLLYYTANPDLTGGEPVLSFACGAVEVQQ